MNLKRSLITLTLFTLFLVACTSAPFEAGQLGSESNQAQVVEAVDPTSDDISDTVERSEDVGQAQTAEVPDSIKNTTLNKVEKSVSNTLVQDLNPTDLPAGGATNLVPDQSLIAAGTSSGTEYLVFWRGDLRIFAQEDDTEVQLIDIDTGLPLSFLDGRIESTNFPSNPFTLELSGDSFEGIGGTEDFDTDIRVKILSTKPVSTWTGFLDESMRHPDEPPSGNPWMSYIPAFSEVARSSGRELGKQFLGFTSRDMYIFALKGEDETLIEIDDLITNTDVDDDDTHMLDPGSGFLEYFDEEIEIYHLNKFEDDTVRVTSNVEISVMVGVDAESADDWTITPPSYGAGEDGFERGTLFYTFVNRSLTVFPLEDDTSVTITDLSDGDDSKGFVFTNGDTSGDYDLYTPVLETLSGGNITPRSFVNIITDSENPFDADFVKVESDKPVLLYVGPAGSNINEFADVAYSVPIGSGSFIVYVYAQNGGAKDLQVFGFSDLTEVSITSLTRTDPFPFRDSKFHDFDIGQGIGGDGWKLGTPGSAVWWGSDEWTGELLRIEADLPIVVLNGDYDFPQFGSFVPFVLSIPPLPPIADAGVDQSVAIGEIVQFDGTGSFDQDVLVGNLPFIHQWDLNLNVDSDNDGDPTNDVDVVDNDMPTLSFDAPGTYPAQLTYFDDEGESDTDIVVITVLAPDLAITKDNSQDSVQPGEVISYDLNISNVSPTGATGVVVMDTIPEHSTFVDASDTWSFVDGVVTWEPFDLPGGDSVVRNVTVRINDTVPAGVDTIANTATVEDDGTHGADQNPDDNTATDVDALDGAAPDLLIIKDDGGIVASPGGEIVYALNYENVGNQGATGVTIMETVPENTTFNAASSTPGWSCDDGDPAGTSCDFLVGAVGVGASGSVDFAVTVDEEIPVGTFEIINTAVIMDDGENGPDPDPDNNESTTTTTGESLPPVCALYPIALHIDTVLNADEGDLLEDIWNGAQPGNFGWLTWTGANGQNVLVTSLTPPGDSDTYINLNDPLDNIVSIGDWVQGRPGVTNSQAVRAALDVLMTMDIIIPVWDMVEENGANTNYHVVNFAKVRITDYHLPGQNRISAEFIEFAVCGN